MTLLSFKLYAFLVIASIPLPCLAVSVNYPLEDQLPNIARIGQPFSWSFSPLAFQSESSEALQYTAYSLPAWLTFDPQTRTFSGTPDSSDEGRPQIRVEAEDSHGHTASTVLTLCVTPYQPPALSKPIAQQFVQGNPSLSSVFLPAPNSTLVQDINVPTLRVPSRWSFSIGFEYDTFNDKSNIFYDARKADGSPLPDWMQFSATGITVDGVAPREEDLPTPATIKLMLHASDQKGFTAEKLPFNLVIASHELSLAMSTLPTINVTSGEPFDIVLASPLDYTGVLVDGAQIQPDNITSFIVDTSSSPGLAYDTTTHRLKGKAPSSTITLPVSLQIDRNQTLNSTVRLTSVSSSFTRADLGDASTGEGDKLQFDLKPYLTDAGASEDIDLSVSLIPIEASSWLSFSSSSRSLSGTAPKADPGYESVSVTFTAYSHNTHSTSHALLSVDLADSTAGGEEGGAGVGAASRRRGKIVSILTVVFGVLGGLLALGLLIAALTKCARVKDTALSPEEAMHSYTEKEKQYYNLTGDEEKGYGFSASKEDFQSDMSLSESFANRDELQLPSPAHAASRYGAVGLGIQPGSPASSMMTKANFMQRVRTAARNVSDKARKVSGARPIIGKPMSVQRSDALEHGTPSIVAICGPLYDISNEPVRGPSPSHVQLKGATTSRGVNARLIRDSRGEAHARSNSTGSTDSLSSLRTHEETAIVQRAQRATSIRNLPAALTARNIDPDARMMPGRSRMPVLPTRNGSRTGHNAVRITSQVISVHNAQADDIETSMAYVNAYNTQDYAASSERSPGSPSSPRGRVPSTKRASTVYTTNMSFSAGESPSMASSRADSRAGLGHVDKIVTPGSQTVVTLRLSPEGARAQTRGALRLQQTDGAQPPDFLRAELKARPGHSGEIVIRAMPPVDCADDFVAVAVYDGQNNCVSSVVRFEISQEV